MADPLTAPVGELEAGLLAGHQNRLVPVRLRLAVGLQELDRPTLALALLAQPELGLETLHMQTIAVPVLVEVLAEGIEHLVGPGDEGLAVAPVGTQPIEVLGPHAPVLARELLVETEAIVALG